MIKLSLTQKTLASSAVFALILCGLLYLLVSAKSDPIVFAEQEVKGNLYQRPLEKILKGLGKHRIISQRVLYGDTSSVASQTETQGLIDQAISELEGVDKEVGVDLQFTDDGLRQRKREHAQVKSLRQEWSELKGNVQRLKAQESNEEHAKLIANVRTMIAHAGDTSNLILDPDLDSYYLMDITLLALPQSQDRIQNVITELEPIVRRGKVSPEERVKLAVFSALMREADLERTKADFQTVLNEDINFYGKLASLHTETAGAHSEFVNAYGAFIQLVEEMASSEKMTVSIEKFLQVSDKSLSESFKYWDMAVGELDKLLTARTDFYKKSRSQATVISIALLIAFSIFSWWFSRRLSKQLQVIVHELVEESAEVKSASKEITTSSQNLAQAAGQQASALQQTASAIEEMNSMVKKSTENTSKSREVANASQETASRGQQTVENMNTAMKEINDSNQNILRQVEDSNRRITEIVKVITEIGSKTKVINDIVFQTKLLSFNASVEAARAGEHGKGFAVVAEEVGNLAQMSGNAAKEISQMLDGSISQVQSIVTETKEKVEKLIFQGKETVQRGITVSKECGEILHEIVSNVTSVSSMIEEIAAATQEQSIGINEITKAMNQLDQVTHANSASSQQGASSAEILSGRADSLMTSVETLEGIINGGVKGGESIDNTLANSYSYQEKSTEKTHRTQTSKKVPVTQQVPRTMQTHNGSPRLKVVGGDALPSEDDPRFKEA